MDYKEGQTIEMLKDYSMYYNIRVDKIINIEELKNCKVGNFIVNLDSNYKRNGTHWISIIKLKNIIFYFDPFGIKPPLKIGHCYYNNHQFQKKEEKLCGMYALLFLFFGENIENEKEFDLVINKMKQYEIK